MEKKEYIAPEVTAYGDVKEITQSGGADFSSPDHSWIEDGQAYTSYDPVS